jgi:hypothetical protein
MIEAAHRGGKIKSEKQTWRVMPAMFFHAAQYGLLST